MADLTVYGADWCPDCRRSKKLLDRLSVPYTYVDVDADSEAMATMMALNGGRQSIPVVLFPDGHHLVEPSDPALRAFLHAAGLIPG
ncbi:MAG TPA: glutaredoxin family protein [Motilibacterales bacterium]|nr:glutaredoxin family protein [Motilibacterales bacterium]